MFKLHVWQGSPSQKAWTYKSHGAVLQLGPQSALIILLQNHVSGNHGKWMITVAALSTTISKCSAGIFSHGTHTAVTCVRHTAMQGYYHPPYMTVITSPCRDSELEIAFPFGSHSSLTARETAATHTLAHIRAPAEMARVSINPAIHVSGLDIRWPAGHHFALLLTATDFLCRSLSVGKGPREAINVLNTTCRY